METWENVKKWKMGYSCGKPLKNEKLQGFLTLSRIFLACSTFLEKTLRSISQQFFLKIAAQAQKVFRSTAPQAQKFRKTGQSHQFWRTSGGDFGQVFYAYTLGLNKKAPILW